MVLLIHFLYPYSLPGEANEVMLPQISSNLVILCYDRQCADQNTVVHLKSKYLSPSKLLSCLRYCL